MPVRFLISTLKPGVDPADYEAWVRDRDYALVRSLPNYVSYRVHRIRPPIQGAPDFELAIYRADRGQSFEQHDKDLHRWRKRREELYGKFLDRSKKHLFRQRRDRIGRIDVSKPHCPGCSSKGIWNVD